MFEVFPARSVLHSEAHFLQSGPPVIVLPQHVYTSPLQRTKEAPLPAGFVVCTLTIVCAVPHRLILEKFVGFEKDLEVVRRDWLVALLQFGTTRGDFRSLPQLLSRRGSILASPTYRQAKNGRNRENEVPLHALYRFSEPSPLPEGVSA
jgi:hypothetical protein